MSKAIGWVVLPGIGLLAILAGVNALVVYDELPWPWPTDKWQDFWIALSTGIIVVGSVGAIASFLIERRLRELDDLQRRKQFDADCLRDWTALKRRLFYRTFIVELDDWSTEIPKRSQVLVDLLETAPTPVWKAATEVANDDIFTQIENFEGLYYVLESRVRRLSSSLVEWIAEFNRGQASPLQVRFCMAWFLQETSTVATFDIDMANHWFQTESASPGTVPDRLIVSSGVPRSEVDPYLATYTAMRPKLAKEFTGFSQERSLLVKWTEDICLQLEKENIHIPKAREPRRNAIETVGTGAQ